MTRLPTDAFAVFVDLDWADAKPDVCLHAAGSETRECSVLAHTLATIDEWVHTLPKRFKGQLVAICLELNTGPSVSARRALAPLVAHRRRLVGDQVRMTNRLTSTLKHSFPHVLQWLHDNNPTICCDFLAQWPTLRAAQLARCSVLERFFYTHPVRSADVIDQRLPAIKSATPLTPDAGIIIPTALLVQALVTQLRVTLPAIEDFDHALAHRAQSHPDFSWFAALAGAGAVFAPHLLVAFGAPRERSASADALQKYAGLAPVTERRGHTTWVHWRLQCPTCLRQTFVEWAAASIRHAFWARAYYQQPRAQGQAPQAAVRALACTWIRIRYRCWQNHTPYDETLSLRALTHHASSLLHNLVKSSDNVKNP